MRLRLFTILFFLLLTMIVSAQTGSIRGAVFDNSTGESLPGVTVVIEGTSKGTITDLDGIFNLVVEPGIYTLRISYISYETINIKEIEIKAGEVEHLGELRLKEASISLNAVVVTAKEVRNTETALLSIKSKSINLVDGISAGSLQKIGDSDAGEAIKRVPGVSVTNGKYVFVRGLGDRYTKTTLNGVDIPGLDPDRNSLQIDIFPTNVINNIIVNKTFNASLPADFTGGLVDIEIKDFPNKKAGKASVSIGYNPNAHFNDEFLSYKGGDTDFLGFDDDARDIPATDNIPQFGEVVVDPNGPEGTRYQEILRGFNPTMAAMQQKSFSDISFGISFGNQVPKEKVTLGYNLSFSYKNTTDFYKDAIDAKWRQAPNPDVYELERAQYQAGDIGINNVLLSGLAGFAIKTQYSKYRINLLYLRNGEKKAGIFDYESDNLGTVFSAFQHNLDYSQRSLSNIFIDGTHTFSTDSKWKFNWKLSPSLSKIEDPDVRFTRYQKLTNGGYRIGTEVGFPERIWRELDEINIGVLTHFTRDYLLNGNKSKLKFGAGYTYKYRDYIIRNFALNIRGNFSLEGDPNELLREENLWPRGGDVNIGTTYETPFIPNNPNEYEANNNNITGYISTELGITNKFKTTVGVRIESFTQYYTGSNQSRKTLNNEEVLSNLDFFPNLNLFYKLTEKQNLRFSYSKTIARPSFKELSYAEIYDPISSNTFIGGFHTEEDAQGNLLWDGNLQSTYIQNYDIRWELFHKRGQMVSVSGFYKTFKNPIEIVQYSTQEGSFQPRNVGDGTVLGAEFELRQKLDFISAGLSGFKLIVNLTALNSNIKMSNTEYEARESTLRTGESLDHYRPMAGMAPYIVNLGFLYNGSEEGFWKRLETGVFYNVQGESLEYIATAGLPDIYIKPFHSLNFNSNLKLGQKEKFILNLKIKNILNSSKELIYKSYNAPEDYYFKKRVEGTTFTLGLSYKF